MENEYNYFNNKKIAIIGGGYLQLPLIEKCKDMGIETHCFAWKDGAVCEGYADYFYPISIVDKDAILDKCKEIGIDGVVSIASDVAVITVNYIAHNMGLVANPLEFTDISTNKYKMREALSNAGLPCPRYQVVKSDDDVDLSSNVFPMIVKPTDRSGSRGVQKVFNRDELLSAIKRAQDESFSNEAIVEEFIEGSEVSVESISFDGKHHILQITDKITTGSPFFVELEHHQPSGLPEEIKKVIRSIVIKALDALHIRNGASHSELKIGSNGSVKIIEIGARMGGDFIGSDLVKLSTGYDFVKGVIEISMGIFHDPVISEDKCSGVYFLSRETAHLMKFFEEGIPFPEIIRKEILDKDLRNVQESADRSGYLIYQSEHRLNIQ